MNALTIEQRAQAEEVLRRVWGYESFRPLQREAVEVALSRRDSLVVLPTGGGKSICYQVPALCQDGLSVVVSPLISLMKDQVDALATSGVAAAFLNSSQSADEQRSIARAISQRQLKLLYVAPERLLTERMLSFLQSAGVAMFAIDEAHCISDWGHDFRPEYRGLRALKERFPGVPVHGYTATAPEHVRSDIVAQLGLVDAEVLVGSFDRPNLVYRMWHSNNRFQQVMQVIARHPGQSGIVYCISRKEVERTALALNQAGVKAVAYHAGLDDDTRRRHQEQFIRDQVDVVVATVAFGMGIDKPDVRFVVHAGMPKTIEHYQQESGRAGRDGLEAECVLIHSGGDVITWTKMAEALEPAARRSAEQSLRAMKRLCESPTCRHKALSAYFGQELAADNCGACDVCLGELDQVEDPITLGQKILSCILRLDQRFGADYTAKVLTGSTDKRIEQFGHNRLSTYGLLKEHDMNCVRQWIEQLISQQFLVREGEYQQLRVTPSGMQLLRREVAPILTQPPERKAAMRHTAVESESWEGVDRGLFDHLRQLRLRLAAERNVPAYVILGDATLRELARIRPASLDKLHGLRGIGQQKLSDFGQILLDAIDTYCHLHPLERDVQVAAGLFEQTSRMPAAPGMSALTSFEFWRQGMSIEEVAAKMGRARSTVMGYLCEFIHYERVVDVTPWVDAADIAILTEALRASEDGRLKPIFEAFGGKYTYDQLRLVNAALRARTQQIV